MLRQLGASVFGDEDPVGIFYRGRPYTIRRDGEGFVLELELPFTSRDEVHLNRFGDELVDRRSASWRRNLILPRVLLDAPTTGGAFHDHTLRIEFGPPPRSAAEAAKGA